MLCSILLSIDARAVVDEASSGPVRGWAVAGLRLVGLAHSGEETRRKEAEGGGLAQVAGRTEQEKGRWNRWLVAPAVGGRSRVVGRQRRLAGASGEWAETASHGGRGYSRYPSWFGAGRRQRSSRRFRVADRLPGRATAEAAAVDRSSDGGKRGDWQLRNQRDGGGGGLVLGPVRRLPGSDSGPTKRRQRLRWRTKGAAAARKVQQQQQQFGREEEEEEEEEERRGAAACTYVCMGKKTAQKREKRSEEAWAADRREKGEKGREKREGEGTEQRRGREGAADWAGGTKIPHPKSLSSH
ncbi:hypothetical protein BT93_E1258 [Corymbia citriodora subsp. variegata]|nr:hypothetical protein BT93_E1258 [Corymbia citriodora subsp. variegata]